MATDGRLRGGSGGVGTASEQVGTEHPLAPKEETPLVERAFAFVDLCGFTSFMAEHGEHAAIDALETFHALARTISTRRGVRIAKWLGDGAMLVGVEVGPLIATAAELVARCDSGALALRGGLAHGWALLFEGDDYIGRPVNLAARLCQAARPGELLAVGYPSDALPEWIAILGTRDLSLRGLGRLRRVQRLGVLSSLEAAEASAPTHPTQPTPRKEAPPMR
jgi:class 3 adenylate cyclase